MMMEPLSPTINFYHLHKPYGFFSNFARYPIDLKGKVWPTSEHYFQAQKFVGTEHEEEIRQAETPREAAQMGRDWQRPLRPDWEVVKDDIMREALYAKFTQHPDLKEQLLGTGDATLVEHTHNDKYWGDGGDGMGKNMLGKLLMEIRELLRYEDLQILNRIEIIKGDITKIQVDAIVNAANESLLGGGGVDGAIHRAAGPHLIQACRLLGGCKTGQAKITQGYNLPAKWIIHTVGPVWRGGLKKEPELLASCYQNSLKLAIENDIQTIAFPAISCGVYGYPIKDAAAVAIAQTAAFLAKNQTVEKVTFICFSEETYEAWQAESAKALALEEGLFE